MRGTCPTLCDADCETACHENHDIPQRREHDPADCPSTVDRVTLVPVVELGDVW